MNSVYKNTINIKKCIGGEKIFSGHIKKIERD